MSRTTFKFPKSTQSNRAFVALPELLSSDKHVQEQLREFINSVAMKGDLSIQKSWDLHEKTYKGKGGQFLKVNEEETGVVFDNTKYMKDEEFEPEAPEEEETDTGGEAKKIKVSDASMGLPGTGAENAINFSTIDYNTGFTFSPPAQNVNVPEDGVYCLVAGAKITATYNAGRVQNYYEIHIYVGSSKVASQNVQPQSVNGIEGFLSCATTYSLTTTDNISVTLAYKNDASANADSVTDMQLSVFQIDTNIGGGTSDGPPIPDL